MQEKCILFDLDGTLTDPFRGITRSVQYSLEKFGIHAVLEELKCFIGPPLIDSYEKYFDFSEEQAKLAVGYYRELYNDGGAKFDNRVYDGIPEMLGKLRNSGKKIILATSKPLIFAEQILEHFGLQKYFDRCFGCELDGRRTRKDEVIEYAVEQYEINKNDAVMVGDREQDVIGAHKNGIKCIGVRWGYAEENELEEYGADWIVSTIEELERILLA